MPNPLVVRNLRRSNLGWFLRTRTSVGEAAGRERAININKDVMKLWFGDLSVFGNEIPLTSCYLSGFGPPDRRPMEIVIDQRTLRLQGGGKNWRLAGDAIRGDYYDVRQNDLLFMDFSKDERLLSWIVVRQGESGPSIPGEKFLYQQLVEQLGPASESMWVISDYRANAFREQLLDFFPAMAKGIDWNFEGGQPGTEVVDAANDSGRLAEEPSYSDLILQIGAPSPVSRSTGTTTTSFRRSSLSRKAVLLRSGGVCENPDCSGMPVDTTRSGNPILDVDHILDLGLGGSDHPSNMIALCPNCHAMKTRGQRSEYWRTRFLKIAFEAHSSSSPFINENPGCAIEQS